MDQPVLNSVLKKSVAMGITTVVMGTTTVAMALIIHIVAMSVLM
jgi:N-acyl-D-aspartate/D-glutamate deacylase